MLTVIKRSGREEPFDTEKIINTLAAASDELRQPLGSSDLRFVANRTLKQLEERDKVTSREVFTSLVDVLETEGYPKLAKAYSEDAHNHWK